MKIRTWSSNINNSLLTHHNLEFLILNKNAGRQSSPGTSEQHLQPSMPNINSVQTPHVNHRANSSSIR